MAQIHLVEGPVGAGKSTYARTLLLRNNAVHLDLDEWMVNLFSADRPQSDFMAWYNERKLRCSKQIWRLTLALIEREQDVVLELGLVSEVERGRFFEEATRQQKVLQVYLLEATVEERRVRVQQRNRTQSGTFKMIVSDEIFEMADRAWQPVEDWELGPHRLTRIT